jgi:hypothetical protein
VPVDGFAIMHSVTVSLFLFAGVLGNMEQVTPAIYIIEPSIAYWFRSPTGLTLKNYTFYPQ